MNYLMDLTSFIKSITNLASVKTKRHLRNISVEKVVLPKKIINANLMYNIHRGQ